MLGNTISGQPQKNGWTLHSDPLPLPGLTAFGSLVSSCFGAFLPIGTWPTPSLGHTETQLELSRGFRCSVSEAGRPGHVCWFEETHVTRVTILKVVHILLYHTFF